MIFCILHKREGQCPECFAEATSKMVQAMTPQPNTQEREKATYSQLLDAYQTMISDRDLHRSNLRIVEAQREQLLAELKAAKERAEALAEVWCDQAKDMPPSEAYFLRHCAKRMRELWQPIPQPPTEKGGKTNLTLILPAIPSA
jgi:hypothetical protein